jgi:hypothetical protein
MHTNAKYHVAHMAVRESLHVKYSIFLDDKQDGPHQKPRMNQGVRAG